jgi:hypothetical protein
MMEIVMTIGFNIRPEPFEYNDRWMGAFEYEQESAQRAPQTRVRARILWPALGFPAVIAPRNLPPGRASLDADTDATRTICVLLLSDRKYLSKAEAARYLRYVPWAQRGRRHIPPDQQGAFVEAELSVRNDGKESRLIVPKEARERDRYGTHIVFGADREGNGGITVNLAHRVRDFYQKLRPSGIAYLHEIRISEVASARLQDGLYHLFWNNEDPNEQAPSDEIALLLREFVPQRRAKLRSFLQQYRRRLFEEYEYEYGVLRASYASKPVRGRPRAEILHPLFVRRNASGLLKIGHLTDTHVDVRADVYEENLKRSNVAAMYPNRWRPDSYNNWNRSFVNNYSDAKRNSDILLLTGDLIDYGRGHWGVQARDRLGDDSYYHEDRNWFLFYHLLASSDAYQQPTYTILGNHDWRLNPYPPFAIAGAPSPKLLINNYHQFTEKEQADILRKAHGPGYDRKFSYNLNAKGIGQLLLHYPLKALKNLAQLVFQTKTVDERGSPAATSIEAVEWYLFSINPFFDYWFSLPTGHKLLMLDWAEDENVLFPIVDRGENWPYMVWQASAASDPGPKARNCLTKLQQSFVKDFTSIPAAAKIIGIHAPPIGPYPDWFDGDLLKGVKIYDKSVPPRGPTTYATRMPDGRIQKWNGHPLFAIKPRDAGAGVVADYGSFESWRNEFLMHVAAPGSGVRLVFSGHIHRSGLYVVHVPTVTTNLVQAGNMHVRGVTGSLVRGARPPAVAIIVEGKNGPLFVNTTSAGPRGNAHPALKQDAKIAPGHARAELASDGTIHNVEFYPPPRVAVPIPTRPAQMQREASIPAYHGRQPVWPVEPWRGRGAM